MEADIVSLRHYIHSKPELSNHEFNTSEYVKKFILNLSPSKSSGVSKTGLLFTFDSGKEGPTTVFRSELDALPIVETTDLSYSSKNGFAHSCGHDGHIAILCRLAEKIAENRPKKGKCVLLFQPAEEVEQGARDVVNSNEFSALHADYMFALHNVPGYNKHKILLRRGSFAAASKGLIIKLLGKTSHAAEPENGISPKNAIAKIIFELNKLMESNIFSDKTLSTMVFMKMGEQTFGTSPGYAEVMLTLRAFQNTDMEILCSKIENLVAVISQEENLEFGFSYCEEFPATINNNDCVDMILSAAKELNFNHEFLPEPFKWSEDFAYFTNKYKGGIFGLGSGLNQPQLHNSNFDFPDEIIETGSMMFFNVCKKLNY